MIDSMVAQGRVSGNYSMTPTELTNRYVRTLEPLERLRSVFVDEVFAHFAADRDHALRVLAAACGASALILAILGYVLVFARRSVFRPLLRAHDDVIALAEERAHPHYASPPLSAMPSGEMGGLFDALEVLRRKLRERASLTAQPEHQARTDSLTGLLLNRRALELVAAGLGHDALARSLGVAGATEESEDADTVSLILMDIDRFKQINDRYGHPAGDQVLRAVASLMRSMVGPADALARFGGEEFAVLVPDLAPGHALALAEKLRATIAGHPVRLPDGSHLHVTASFGVASGGRGERHWRPLIAAADAAMYQAKAEGRNCVRHADAAEKEESVIA
jgi:diguanylate cyclase (GGDEF)-like protein